MQEESYMPKDETVNLKDLKMDRMKWAHQSNKQYLVQFGICILATLALLGGGMHKGWVGPTLHRLMSNDTEIPRITRIQTAWLASSLALGGVTGPIIGSILAAYFGRKTTILIVAIPSLITWIIISFATNVYQLCVAQFLSGVGIVIAYTALPLYIGEIASPRIRGALGTFIALQFHIGFLIESIIVPYISVSLNSIIASIVPLLLLCLFIWAPESPYYYLMINQPERAAKSLRILTQTDCIDKQLEMMTAVMNEKRQNTQKICALFKNRYNQKSFLIVLGVVTIQELTAFGPIASYAQMIFAEAETPIDPYLGGVILSVMSVVFLFGSTIFVDKWGRRLLLIMSTFMTAMPLIMIGVYFHLKAYNYTHINNYSWVPLLALALFKFTYSFGIGPLPTVCVSEMFDTKFKAYASGCLCCYGSLGGFTVAMLFRFLADFFGAHIPFYFFSICCLCGTVFIYKFVPETKRKTLEEIQQSFREISK